MNEVEFSKMEIEELCDKLELNEKAQQNIYNIYRRAAEFSDETLKELKKEEKFIKIYIQRKIGMVK